MGQLVLLVVAAAWAAVLLPPMLRSRVENRPNSSVVDFRRQLNRLQSTVPTRTGGSLRPVGRQLAPSPLQRPAAAGRPGAPAARGRAPMARETHARTHHSSRSTVAHQSGSFDGASMRARRHGHDTAGHDRAHRQAHVSRSSTSDVRRRRTNVLFMLVVATASTLFLAATTKATVMLYLFALAFLALCGYVYLLAQIRQREQQSSSATWPHEHSR
ncbi:hypothetical protein BH23ACT3_BH23ACT3_04560 [soil metagenome]